MQDINQHPYLYLTTIGRKTGNPHEIEIWYVAHEGRFYMVSEHPERSDWVRNLMANSAVMIKVGTRTADALRGTARLIDRAAEPELARAVADKMNAKYHWSSGQIVEIHPHG